MGVMDDGSLNILYLSAEILPYAATGGLAQVAAALPRALRRAGEDVRVFIPRYGRIHPEKLGLKRVLEAFPVPFERDVMLAGLWQAPETEVPIYFIENQRFFGSRQGIYSFPDDGERFVFYTRASMEAARHLDWRPHIIHANEWHTALAPNWLRTIYGDDPFFAKTAALYTIHNLAYQGIFGYRILQIAGIESMGFIAHPEIAPSLNQVVSMMARGIIFADVITTVSPSYAREILTPEFGEGLAPLLRDRRERLFGVIIGLDMTTWNPAADPALPCKFDGARLDARAECKVRLQKEVGLTAAQTPALIGLTARLSDQKGFDILTAVLEPMLRFLPLQFIVMGAGDERYHHQLTDLQRRYPGQLAFIPTYDEALARRIYAGSDIFLMPSRREPGGLDQLKAMRYGAVPVVHATGGLRDTVIDHHLPEMGTGFRFEPYDCMALYAAVARAVEIFRHPDLWRTIQQNAMRQDFSVDKTARAYVKLYRHARSLKLTGQPLPDLDLPNLDAP
ncbi:MAG TPA: glycogen synthase [Anaerolineae bacterium]|nr:glycogen synthase [Anaerolineae bacterium]